MAPDIERFLNSVDDPGRREFLRKVIAGAAFAPPLNPSFSLVGPSIMAAEAGVPNPSLAPTTLYFDFSGTEYQDNFRDILRAGDINRARLATHLYPSLNFPGARTAGATWMTVLDSAPGTGDEGPLFTKLCELSLSVDILIRPFNNNKGAGLLAFFNEGIGKKGLVLIILNAGNTDTLQLSTVDQAGKLTLMTWVPLNAGIVYNVGYRMTMQVVDPVANVSVTGKLFQHVVATNPNSPLGPQVGGTLTYTAPLPSGVDTQGEVGLVARAVNAVVDTSVTNFTVVGAEFV
jgi:hypothetical protein